MLTLYDPKPWGIMLCNGCPSLCRSLQLGMFLFLYLIHASSMVILPVFCAAYEDLVLAHAQCMFLSRWCGLAYCRRWSLVVA